MKTNRKGLEREYRGGRGASRVTVSSALADNRLEPRPASTRLVPGPVLLMINED